MQPRTDTYRRAHTRAECTPAAIDAIFDYCTTFPDQRLVRVCECRDAAAKCQCATHVTTHHNNCHKNEQLRRVGDDAWDLRPTAEQFVSDKSKKTECHKDLHLIGHAVSQSAKQMHGKGHSMLTNQSQHQTTRPMWMWKSLWAETHQHDGPGTNAQCTNSSPGANYTLIYLIYYLNGFLTQRTNGIVCASAGVVSAWRCDGGAHVWPAIYTFTANIIVIITYCLLA